MNDYRPLTAEEIEALQQNGCWAEDWSTINVAEDFLPSAMQQVTMYGEVNIGSFNKSIEVSPGFSKHSGIRNATLNHVTIGDDCLVENIGCFISNYTIGDECYLSNVAIIQTTDGATYGEGNLISVLNEAGEGNLLLYSGLSSQLAAYMLRITSDKEAQAALFRLIREGIQDRLPERGFIGSNVKITNTKEITNCIINDYCEINGAERLCDCTLLGDVQSNSYIGTGVIIENSIVDYDASVVNGANIQDCFIGEACQVSNGFSASASVFFANSVLSNGEACAAFCGPFSASHHKSSLLIGGMFSFYNAGSATNFSNHAYKMGPIHWGILERGTKTASGSYLFMPSHIGSYSVCLGKTMTHPDTSKFPFSYIIGKDAETILVPGRNLITVGLYRDINKWPKRDLRSLDHRKSLINQDWLSPFVIQKVIEGRAILQQLLLNEGDTEGQTYQYEGVTLTHHAIHAGITYYDMVIKLYLGMMMEKMDDATLVELSDSSLPFSWTDLGGMLTTEEALRLFTEHLKGDAYKDIETIHQEFTRMHESYQQENFSYAHWLMLQEYQAEELSPSLLDAIKQDAQQAKKQWLEAIEMDAQKEMSLGDVSQDTYQQFVSSIWKETK